MTHPVSSERTRRNRHRLGRVAVAVYYVNTEMNAEELASNWASRAHTGVASMSGSWRGR